MGNGKKRAYKRAPKKAVEPSENFLPGEWLTPEAAAVILSVSVECLNYWSRKKILPRSKIKGTRCIRYNKQDINKLLEQNRGLG